MAEELAVTLETDKEVVEIEEYCPEGVEFAKKTLVGKIIFEKILNRGAVKSIIAKAWGEPDGLKIADMGPNVFMFTFKDKGDAHEIIKRGPWYVMGHILSLQYWIPEVAAAEVDYSRVSFWVQLHGMPLGTMTSANVVKLMTRVGEVIEVENPLVEGILLRSYMRVRLYMDITKPIPTGVWIPRKDLPNTWISFRFEKLQDLCYKCGVFGHNQWSCSKERVMSGLDKDLPKYGPHLSVPPAKALAFIAKNYGRWHRDSPRYERSEKSSTMGESPCWDGKPEAMRWKRTGEGTAGSEETLVRQQQDVSEEREKGKGVWYPTSQDSHSLPTKAPAKQVTPSEGGDPPHDAIRKAQRQYVDVIDKVAEKANDFLTKKNEMEAQEVVQSRLIEKGLRETGAGEDIQEAGHCPRPEAGILGTSTIPLELEEDVFLQAEAIQGKVGTMVSKEDFLLKCFEGMRPEEGLTNPRSLSLVDIECDLPRAGLGPENMDLLGFEKEEIGLASPVLLKDYISPPRINEGPFEVHLSPGSIKKGKQACSNIHNKGRNIELKRPTRRERLRVRGPELYHGCKEIVQQERQNAGEYYVEFPSDEDSNGHPLSVEEEGLLVTHVQQNLYLKRNWSTTQGSGENVLLIEDNETHKKRRADVGENVEENDPTPMIHDGVDSMAEEAGLNMPPKGP